MFQENEITDVSVYAAPDYVAYVSQFLRRGRRTTPRGAVKRLAQRLRCHSTFISQILRKKAYFSHEQAIRFCAFADLSESESEYFVDLLNRDRAGAPEARAHFDRILLRKRKDRSQLKNRIELPRALTREQEILYFQGWHAPLVHAALHLPEHGRIETLARTLKFSVTQVEDALKLLASLGLAKQENAAWLATQSALHVSYDSPLNSAFHAHWRMKSASILLEKERTDTHTHFSSAFCISKNDMERFRDMALSFVQSLRGEMIRSDSEKVAVFCLDFYPLN